MIKAKRKAPSLKTLRNLYLLSGNQCANPKCTTVLINANGTLVARVCHIKAAQPGGPRFDEKLTRDQRRAAENLILLCSTCHTLVDAEPANYSVRRLSDWKKKREKRFAAVGDRLQQRYVEEVTDEAELADLGAPRTLAGYIKFLDDLNYSHTIDENSPSIVRDYAGQLRHLSSDNRELVRAIVEKAIALGGSREGQHGVSVHPDDLKTLNIGKRQLSDYKIRKLADTLNRNGLGGLDDYGEPHLRITIPDENLTLSDLKAYLENKGNTLHDLICDLQFRLLD